jgi:predicted ArsR family transcriptional regulator
MKQSDLIASDRTLDRLLFTLKMRGATSTSDLAQQLRISVPGVRQHLERLRESGLVQFEDRGRGVGRPARFWSLTDAAEARFPDTHADLTREMIGSIRSALGEEALAKVVASRHAVMEARYREAVGDARRLGTRLERLASARTRDGYMAEAVRTEDGWLLSENHCPICAAAEICQGFCEGELSLFRRLLPGASVERVDHRLAGARRCSYSIRPVSAREGR